MKHVRQKSDKNAILHAMQSSIEINEFNLHAKKL